MDPGALYERHRGPRPSILAGENHSACCCRCSNPSPFSPINPQASVRSERPRQKTTPQPLWFCSVYHLSCEQKYIYIPTLYYLRYGRKYRTYLPVIPVPYCITSRGALRQHNSVTQMRLLLLLLLLLYYYVEKKHKSHRIRNHTNIFRVTQDIYIVVVVHAWPPYHYWNIFSYTPVPPYEHV